MAERKNPIPTGKVVFRRSRPLTKVALTAAIVLSMAALIALRWTQTDLETQTEQMRAEAAALEYENAALEEKISILGSVRSVLDIAMEELGLVDPDTVIIQPD